MRDARTPRRRLIVLLVGVLLWAAAIVARLLHLQLYRADELAVLAHQHLVLEAAAGEELAHHHAVGEGKGLGKVAGGVDAAVADDADRLRSTTIRRSDLFRAAFFTSTPASAPVQQ